MADVNSERMAPPQLPRHLPCCTVFTCHRTFVQSAHLSLAPSSGSTMGKDGALKPSSDRIDCTLPILTGGAGGTSASEEKPGGAAPVSVGLR